MQGSFDAKQKRDHPIIQGGLSMLEPRASMHQQYKTIPLACVLVVWFKCVAYIWRILSYDLCLPMGHTFSLCTSLVLVIIRVPKRRLESEQNEPATGSTVLHDVHSHWQILHPSNLFTIHPQTCQPWSTESHEYSTKCQMFIALQQRSMCVFCIWAQSNLLVPICRTA